MSACGHRRSCVRIILYARWALRYMKLVNEYIHEWYADARRIGGQQLRREGGGDNSLLYALR